MSETLGRDLDVGGRFSPTQEEVDLPYEKQFYVNSYLIKVYHPNPPGKPLGAGVKFLSP